MAELYFKVSSDWEEVQRLRAECEKLESQLLKMNRTKAPSSVAELESRLGESRQKMRELVDEAARAGATLESSFKSSIYNASKSVNDLTEKIIAQRSVVKGVGNDVQKLSEQYRKMTPGTDKSNAVLTELNQTKKSLQEARQALFNLSQEKAKAQLSTKRLKDEYSALRDESRATAGATDNLGISLQKAFAVIGGAAAVKSLVSNIVNVRGEFQKLELSFGTMLKSEERAAALMKDLIGFAAKTPFSLASAASGAKQLMAYGTEAGNIAKELTMLGDVAAGVGQPLTDIVYLYGTLRAQGRAYALDIRQFAGRGIPIYKELAKVLGVAEKQVTGLVKAGKVGFEEVEKAFQNMTSAGGLYGGLMEQQATSVTGRMEKLSDAMQVMFNNMGKSSEGAIYKAIDTASSLVENYETVGRLLAALVTTYGAYRAALFFVAAATKMHITEQIKSNIVDARGAVITGTRTVASRSYLSSLLAQTAATKAGTAAQAIFNAAAKANPYVLLATVIVGVATAMWALRDSTTAAEKAMKSYNAEREKAAEAEEKHKAKIESLINTARDETAAMNKRILSLKELQKAYPGIFKDYDIEKLKLAEILDLKKQISEQDSQKSLQDTRGRADEIRRQIGALEKGLADAISHPTVNTTALMTRVNNDIARLREELKLYEKDIATQSEAMWEANTPLSVQHDTRQKNIAALKEENRLLDDQIKKQKEINESGDVLGYRDTLVDEARYKANEKRIADLEELQKKSNASVAADAAVKNKEYWEKQRDDAQAQLEAWDASVKKGTDEWTAQKKKLEEAQKALEAWDFKKSSGKDSKDSKEKEANRLKAETAERLAAIKEAQERIARQEEEYILERRQKETDLMEEGTEKTIKQIELDYDKEIAEIAKKADELIKQQQEIERRQWEAANPKWKETGATPPSPATTSIEHLSQAQQDYIDSLGTIANDARKKAEGDFLKELTEKYQDYTAQRLAIEKKYSADIAALQSERAKEASAGNTQAVEQLESAIAQATKEKGKELISFDFGVLQKSPEYVRAFEDLKNTSTETLNSLLGQLEQMKGRAAETLNPADLREYTETIQDIIDELTGRNPFGALAKAQNELSEANKNLAESTKELNATLKSGDEAAIVKAKERHRKALDGVYESNNRLIKSQNDVIDKIGKLNSALRGVGEEIGGQTGEVIELIADIGDFVGQTIKGIEAAATAASTAIAAIEKASVILLIIQAVIKILQFIEKSTTNEHLEYERVAAWKTALNGVRDAVYEYELAVLSARHAEEGWFATDRIRGLGDAYEYAKLVLERYYAKLNEIQAEYTNETGDGFLSNVWNAMTQLSTPVPPDVAARNNLRIETKAARQGLMGIGRKHQETAILEDWARANGYGELFDEEGFISTAAAESILKAHEEGAIKLVGETEKTLETLVEYKKQYDEYRAQLQEYVSSLYEPLVDSMVDSLWAWFDEGKDALDSFREYAADTFRDIVSDMMKTIIMRNVIGTFSEDIAALYDQYAQKKATEEELLAAVARRTNDLIGAYENEMPALQGLMNSVSGSLSNIGIDIKKTGDEAEASENTLRGSLARASQESIDLLAGQMGAVRVALEDLRRMAHEREQETDTQDSAIIDTLTASRDIAAKSLTELVIIREASGRIASVTEEIQQLNGRIAESNDKIATDINSTTACINTIVSTGVKIKGTGLGL
jgi:tape measure domain-containing protein